MADATAIDTIAATLAAGILSNTAPSALARMTLTGTRPILP
jgi:hypothetical protein